MSNVKKRIYSGEPSPNFKSLREIDLVVDYIKRDRETLEESVFYEDCQELVAHWDDTWTRCGICLSELWLYTYDDGREEIVIEHGSMARFHQ